MYMMKTVRTEMEVAAAVAHIGIRTDYFGKSRSEVLAAYKEAGGTGGVAVELYAPAGLTQTQEQECLKSYIQILQGWVESIGAARLISVVIVPKGLRTYMYALIASEMDGRLSVKHLKNRDTVCHLHKSLRDFTKQTYGVDLI